MSLLLIPPYALLVGSQRAALGGAAGDLTAPTLTLPLGLPLGDTSGYLGVTTDEANGTLYYVVTTSATPPSAAQVKAGQNNGGTAAVYAGNQASGSTGAKSATATGLSSNTAYYAYFMHEDAAANQSSVSAASTFSTLTTGTSATSMSNLIGAMSVTPTALRQGYIAQMIQALYASGTWAKTDAMWVMAAHDEQASRLNWITPGSFTLSAVNSPTFTTDQGWAGNNTTSYIDTVWDAATNGVQFTQNSAHISVYQRTQSGNNTNSFGTSTAFVIGVSGRTGTAGTGRVNVGSGVSASTGGSLPLQMIARRPDSANQNLVRDGVANNTAAAASSALSNNDLNFGRYGTTYQSSQLAGGSLGAYIDDTESLAFYNAWHDYMVAVGADT